MFSKQICQWENGQISHVYWYARKLKLTIQDMHIFMGHTVQPTQFCTAWSRWALRMDGTTPGWIRTTASSLLPPALIRPLIRLFMRAQHRLIDCNTNNTAAPCSTNMDWSLQRSTWWGGSGSQSFDPDPFHIKPKRPDSSWRFDVGSGFILEGRTQIPEIKVGKDDMWIARGCTYYRVLEIGEA